MKFSFNQTQALDALEDSSVSEALYGGAAGGGKSILGCYWLAKNCLKYPETRWLMGRDTLKTLKETTLVSFYKVAKMQGLQRDTHYKVIGASAIDNPNSIQFFNGSCILMKDLAFKPSDENYDELGSLEITGAFVDEANQIRVKAKNIVRSRIRHLLDEYGLTPKALWTCNPAKNWVKTEFRDPYIRGSLRKDKRFIQALVGDNEFISEHYAKSLEDLDKASRARLLYADWDYQDDPSALITVDALSYLFVNKPMPTGKKYITVDVARLGDDKTIIRVWDEWKVIDRVELTKSRINATADEVRRLSNKWGVPTFNIIADEDGIGGGVVDILGCKGFIANSRPEEIKNNSNYATFKDQCGWYVADKINKGEVYEAASPEVQEALTEELEQLKDKTVGLDGKRRLMPKDIVTGSGECIKGNIGRSPDEMDTYIMRAAFDLRRKTGPSVITGSIPAPTHLTNKRTI
jgi:phage terminase large subunit